MKALVINGHIKFPQISEGKLNKTIFEESIKAFSEKGYEILETTIDNGYDIANEVVLSKCASEGGIPYDTAMQFLLSDECVDDVQESLQMAAENGISAVPTFIFNDQWSVPGAQDVEMFERLIQRLSERTES